MTTTVISTSFMPPVCLGPSNHHLLPQSGTPSTVPLESLPGHVPIPNITFSNLFPQCMLATPQIIPIAQKKEGCMVFHKQKPILTPAVFVGLTKELLKEIGKMGTWEPCSATP